MSTEGQTPVEPSAEEDLKWPIGFIAMISAAALYVVWRLIQMAGWAIGWLF